MIDVVLPALDEVDAIAALIDRMPPGYRPIVVDNGSTDGTGEVAAGAGATVVVEPTRGFGAACFAGLDAATSDVVCFMDADGSLDPRQLPLVADPVTAGRCDLALGARHASQGAWPIHARLMNAVLARELRRRTGAPLRDLGPMRAARRLDLLDLAIVDRRFGWPLEMVLRAARNGWVIAEVPVTYAPRIGRSKVTGTLRGTARTVHDMGRCPGPMNDPAVIVIAKTPVAGRVKTRCCPPCTPGQAATLAAAALTDTLVAVAACRASRRIVAIDGAPGPWLGTGFELVAQRGAGLGERIDNAFRDVGCPALLIGMDTPQVDAATLDATLALLAPPIDAVVGPAVDGGFWALGLAAPIAHLCAGIGMSSPTTCAQLRAALGRHGASWREVDELEDVDDFATARRVAGDVPGSPYAAVVDRIAAELLTATRASG